MLANERQGKIKDLILKRKTLKISELSDMFHVSEMTIHRDIKPMVEEGFIEKTYGGIHLVHHETRNINANECVVCHRGIEQRLLCRLILTNNRVEATCCAHCGIIRSKMLGDEVIEMLTCDFITNTTISAKNAWFVMDTSLNLGCCQPQVITFDLKGHAEGFVKGFGGIVVNFIQATEKITSPSNNNKVSCHHD